MGRRSKKEFNMEDISPKKVYDLLVLILTKAPRDPYLDHRLKMSLETHSIISDTPFHAKIKGIRRRSLDSRGEDIFCTIQLRDGKTFLTIESVSQYAGTIDFGLVNSRNVKMLYSELRFRLEAIGKPTLDEVLFPDEKVIDHFFPVEYQEIEFFGVITSLRILLCRNKLIFVKINPKKVTAASLGREKTNRGAPYFYGGSICLTMVGVLLLCFITIGGPWSSLYSIILIPSTVIGVLFLIGGISTTYNLFILIQQKGDSFKLIAQREVLVKLRDVINYY